jgi:catechol 2,3-dioxygenase-like lactoylglutathione lyase family enzyme
VIQHVAIEVRRDQAERCRDFYRLLGFADVEQPSSLRDRALWLAHDGTQVHLLFAEDPVAPPEGHLAVVLDDYESVLETLRQAGHDPEPRREHWGSPRAYVRDPAGHLVELMAFPPA